MSLFSELCVILTIEHSKIDIKMANNDEGLIFHNDNDEGFKF